MKNSGCRLSLYIWLLYYKIINWLNLLQKWAQYFMAHPTSICPLQYNFAPSPNKRQSLFLHLLNPDWPRDSF